VRHLDGDPFEPLSQDTAVFIHGQEQPRPRANWSCATAYKRTLGRPLKNAYTHEAAGEGGGRGPCSKKIQFAESGDLRLCGDPFGPDEQKHEGVELSTG